MKDIRSQYNIALAALHAASICNDLGGFTAEHLPAIKTAVEQLDLPIPDVKKKPVEWKEVTKNGHKPGTWPHFFAHMVDISSGDKSVGAIRVKINAINKELQRLDEFDDAYDAKRDERARLIKYTTFVESILDDVIVVMQNAATRFSTLLKQEQMQELKAKPIVVKPIEVAPPPAAPKSNRLTPQQIEDALIELCHGQTRNLTKRYGVARRVMELILVNSLTETYTEDESFDLDVVVHDFVMTTMEHDDEISSSNMSETAWAWMRETLELMVETRKKTRPAPQAQVEAEPVPQQAEPMPFYTTEVVPPAADEDIKSKSTDPLTTLRESGKEKLQPDTVYKMMQDAILYRMSHGDDENESVNQADAAIDAAIKDSQARFGTFSQKEMKAIEDAKYQSAIDLFPEENQPPAQIEPEPTMEETSSPASSEGFVNDALKHQIAQVLQGIKDGNVPTAQALTTTSF